MSAMNPKLGPARPSKAPPPPPPPRDQSEADEGSDLISFDLAMPVQGRRGASEDEAEGSEAEAMRGWDGVRDDLSDVFAHMSGDGHAEGERMGALNGALETRACSKSRAAGGMGSPKGMKQMIIPSPKGKETQTDRDGQESRLRWGEHATDQPDAPGRSISQKLPQNGNSSFDVDLATESPSAANLTATESGGATVSALVTPSQRLLKLCELVNSARTDQSLGLNRLLGEFEEVLKDIQRQKKELLQTRKDVAVEEADAFTARAHAAHQLAVEAAAERYASAAELERKVHECDDKLLLFKDQWRELRELYEALDQRQQDCERKVILARREALKFLSSVEQDARAKAQQYSHDAHARLEQQRIAAVRRGQVLEGEHASLEVMSQELDTALTALSNEKELQTRERNLAEAKQRESSVREQRVAIEEQIEALKRALVVKLEEERRCKEEVQSAQTLLQMLLDAESSNSATLRADRERVT